MLELLNRLVVNKFPKLRVTLSEKVHWKLIYLKYVILGIILAVGLLFLQQQYRLIKIYRILGERLYLKK